LIVTARKTAYGQLTDTVATAASAAPAFPQTRERFALLGAPLSESDTVAVLDRMDRALVLGRQLHADVGALAVSGLAAAQSAAQQSPVAAGLATQIGGLLDAVLSATPGLGQPTEAARAAVTLRRLVEQASQGVPGALALLELGAVAQAILTAAGMGGPAAGVPEGLPEAQAAPALERVDIPTTPTPPFRVPSTLREPSVGQRVLLVSAFGFLSVIRWFVLTALLVLVGFVLFQGDWTGSWEQILAVVSWGFAADISTAAVKTALSNPVRPAPTTT
jgi:hypothetical protein